MNQVTYCLSADQRRVLPSFEAQSGPIRNARNIDHSGVEHTSDLRYGD